MSEQRSYGSPEGLHIETVRQWNWRRVGNLPSSPREGLLVLTGRRQKIRTVAVGKVGRHAYGGCHVGGFCRAKGVSGRHGSKAVMQQWGLEPWGCRRVINEHPHEASIVTKASPSRTASALAGRQTRDVQADVGRQAGEV